VARRSSCICTSCRCFFASLRRLVKAGVVLHTVTIEIIVCCVIAVAMARKDVKLHRAKACCLLAHGFWQCLEKTWLSLNQNITTDVRSERVYKVFV
jgi:hypothetical protein